MLCDASRCSTVAVWVIAFVVVGCGRPAYQLETAPVRGTITLDGQPLPSGYVFVPTQRGRMAKGLIQPDGTFVLSTYDDGDGAQVGAHPVIVSPIPSDDPARTPDMKIVPIPERYASAGTSGLTVEVKPGEDNILELKLTTQPEKK